MSLSAHRRSWRTSALIAAAALGGLPGGAALGVAVAWDDGGGDLLWSTANNWNPNGVPNAASDITFPVTIPNGIATITLASGELANSLIFNNNYILTGGNLTLTAGGGGNITCNSNAIPATINSALIGTAGLTKLGTGDLALGGANTFTGTIAINAGTLMVDTNARLGNTANAITINGGTLDATSSFTSARAVTLGASGGRIVANPGNTLTLTTALTANANALTIGSGTVVLSAASTRTGTTLVQGATLRLSNGAAAGTGAITANLAGVVELNGVTVANPFNLSLNGTIRGLSTSTYSGTITGAASISPLIFSTGTTTTDTLTVGDAANDYTGGSGSTTFINGSGTVILPFANNYAGGWTINSGKLRVQNASSLGTDTSVVVVNNTGTLDLNNVTFARAVTLSNGSALASTGNSTTTGVVTIANNAAVTFGGSGTTLLTIGDAANELTGGGGTSSITVASSAIGSVSLHQPSNYTGSWSVAALGTLEVDGDDRLGNVANPVTLSSGTFRASETFTSARTFTSAFGTIDVSSTKTLTLSSALGTDSGSLTKVGGGTLVLGATSSRNGSSSVNAGTVSLGAFDALGTGTITINSGATLELASANSGNGIVLNGGGTFRGTGASTTWGSLMSIANSATVNIQAPAPGDVFTVGTVTNGIAGGTGSTINVTGNLGTGGGVTVFPAANTYAGGWNVTDNTLRVADASALGSGTSAVVLNNNAVLEVANVTLNRATTMNNGSTLRGTGASAASNGTATVAAGASVTFATGTNSTDVLTLGNAADDITGGNAASTLNVTGAGTVSLTQFSNVIGNWSVNSGTLRVDFDSRLGNAANIVTLNSGATLETPASISIAHTITPNGGSLAANGAAVNLTISSALGAGSGSLNIGGTGSVIVQAASTRTGNTTISSGTLRLSNATALGTAGSGNITVAGAGALEVENATIDKSLTLSADGATLRGVGTIPSYVGTISIPTNVQPVIATGTDASYILTLGNATNDLTGGGGSSQINVNGSGRVILTQASDYTGQWFLNSTLQVSADSQLGNTSNVVFLEGPNGTLLTNNTFTTTRSIITDNGTISANSGATLTVTSSISGGASQTLTKAGTGTVTMAGGGSLTGTVTVNSGTLRLAGSSITTGAYVANAGTVEVGGFNLTNNVTLNTNSNLRGTGISSATGVINAAGPGTITMQTGTSATDVFTIGDAANDLTGGASFPIIRVLATGTIVLAQASNYQGDWSIQAGTVQLNNSAAFGTSGDAIDATGGTIAPNGISISDQISLNGATLADASTSTPATFAGTIVGTTGTSTIALAVPNTASSQSVVISGGITTTNTLNITNTNAGAGAAAIFTNPGNNLTGPIVVANNARLTSNPTNKTSSTLGSGSLTLSGGTLNLLSNADTSYGRNITVSTASGTIFVDRVDTGGGTAHTLTLNSLLINSGNTLMVNSADDYNLATGPLNLTGTAALIQSAATGVYVTGNVTGSGSIRFGDTGITTSNTLAQLMETGVHFKSGFSFPVLGAMQQVNTNLGTPVVGAENAGTVVNWNGSWINDVSASNASFIVVANSGTFRFAAVSTVDTAITASTFTAMNVIGDGTGTFELDAGFLGQHTTTQKLGDLHIGNAKLKTNSTGCLPANSIAFDLTNGGIWQTATNAQTFAGTLSMLRNTTLQTDTGLTLNGPLSIGDGTNTNKVATKTGTGTLTIGGTQTHGTGASLTASAGAVVMNSDAGSTSSRKLQVNAAGGSVTFNTSEHLSGLTVSAASTATLSANTNRVIVADSVSATSGGRIDLKDNKLIVKAGTIGTFNGTAYTGVTGLIASGYNGGTQDGTGIVTSQSAAISPNTLTALGVARAEDVGYAGGTFAGQSVVTGDILVMYTYGGDANLDGSITGDDYFQIDNAFPQGLSGWFNGDFNYDGVINGDDYFVIDSNFPAQGPAFPTGPGAGAGAAAGLVAVPEPASFAFIVAATLLLPAARRRRKRN